MLLSSKRLAGKPKIHFVHGLLPATVDDKQLPRTQKPFAVILRERWIHTVDLIVPAELYNKAEDILIGGLPTIQWSRLTLPLAALLERAFLDTYIKAGFVSMISSGNPRAGDPFYTLHDGLLRLELPKELYERCGLVGSPVTDGTGPHVRRRFAVEIKFRDPSMMQGKPGFNRVRRAFESILTEPVNWLFCNHRAGQGLDNETAPIQQHNPVQHKAEPDTISLRNIQVPDMRSWSEGVERDTDDAMDMLEWVGMVSLESERLQADDNVDPFLSRWEVPEPELASVGDVVRVRWRGFIQCEWVRTLLLQCMAATKEKPDAWYAIAARSFTQDADGEGCDGYTILRTEVQDAKGEGRFRPEFLLWEMMATMSV